MFRRREKVRFGIAPGYYPFLVTSVLNGEFALFHHVIPNLDKETRNGAVFQGDVFSSCDGISKLGEGAKITKEQYLVQFGGTEKCVPFALAGDQQNQLFKFFPIKLLHADYPAHAIAST